MARSCRRSCISWPIIGSGTSSVTSAASASPTFSRSAIWACALRTRVIRSARLARSSATVSNSDASDAHSSVSSGRTFSLTSLTVSSNCSSRSSSGSGWVAAKLRVAPASAPTSCSSTSGVMAPEPTV